MSAPYAMTTTLLNTGEAHNDARGWFRWEPPAPDSNVRSSSAHSEVRSAQMPARSAQIGETLPVAPFVRASATSHAAAESIAPHAGKQAARVLDFLRERGAHGATRAEIAVALEMGAQSVGPRVLELLKAGTARETTATRDTPSGRAATILVASQCGNGELFLQ